MKVQSKLVEVLISDGNRKVNWMHPVDESIAGILQDHLFKPVANSVRVMDGANWKEIPEPERVTLGDCQTIREHGVSRVRIELKSVPEKKVKKTADVRNAADVC